MSRERKKNDHKERIPEAYQFETFGAFFAAICDHLKQHNQRFSYRWLARRLGFSSHSFLIRLTNGTQLPSLEMVTNFCKIFELGPDQSAYLVALVSWQTAKTAGDREYFAAKVAGLRKSDGEAVLSDTDLHILEPWFNAAILELCDVKGASADPKWIAERLIACVSENHIQESLRTLVDAGLISIDDDERLCRRSNSVTTSHNIPSAAIRNFHMQVLDQAKLAITSVPVERRCILGHTMALDSERYMEAERLLFEFRQRFENLLKTSSGDAVYQLGIQFFPITKQ